MLNDLAAHTQNEFAFLLCYHRRKLTIILGYHEAFEENFLLGTECLEKGNYWKDKAALKFEGQKLMERSLIVNLVCGCLDSRALIPCFLWGKRRK